MALYDIHGNLITVSGTVALKDLPPVPISTVNAILKCAYTYIAAVRSGDLVYGDGTGANQQEGKICCSTFQRCLLQGIPYTDYKPGDANTTSASGKRFRYGYRMIDDYYANTAKTTAQGIYNQHVAANRGFTSDNDLDGAEPGDLVFYGTDDEHITHIAMFVYRDADGNPYVMDSTSANPDGKAIKIRLNNRGTIVGIARPNLTAAPFTEEITDLTVSEGAVSLTGYNCYAYWLYVSGSATANSTVNINGVTTTPRYSGKDSRVIIIPFSADETKSITISGLSTPTVKVSPYIIGV